MRHALHDLSLQLSTLAIRLVDGVLEMVLLGYGIFLLRGARCEMLPGSGDRG